MSFGTLLVHFSHRSETGTLLSLKKSAKYTIYFENLTANFIICKPIDNSELNFVDERSSVINVSKKESFFVLISRSVFRLLDGYIIIIAHGTC